MWLLTVLLSTAELSKTLTGVFLPGTQAGLVAGVPVLLLTPLKLRTGAAQELPRAPQGGPREAQRAAKSGAPGGQESLRRDPGTTRGPGQSKSRQDQRQDETTS